ncbi:hypothetical protein ACN9K5_04295 [Aliarcobacter butzleri]|uniref:Uncharacterized protein n=3 Tax=Aliarcobacter butzleri TaxID=28197 RepID=A0AAW6VR01_9BACT|nr:hypothetical protein [Aliarcobacter butzleri]MCG3669256.1 hypothetical protein [Aliarcobacter butzleri]MCG3676720.1 hypothetical protein [Aliarcobacter butzleri]MCT7630778.1 hypothetical protein [Aliarcobacter butzleri]MDK2063212.1 hypothetical protein [Aliarcobacter butzleri]MDK2081913.1 hypothetical protein [Aliarcobacter butzleri]
MQIGKNLKKSKEKNSLVLNIPSNLNQKLIDGYRVKLFSKIKDSLEKKKIALEQEQVQFQEWLEEKRAIDIKNLSINNSFYTPILGA